MLQCRKCKRSAPELAKFCGHCGGRVCAPPPPPKPVKKKKMQFDIDSRLSFTVSEGAELMGISKGMLYEQIKRGNIAFISLGTRLLIPRHALDSLIRENEQPARFQAGPIDDEPEDGEPGEGSGVR